MSTIWYPCINTDQFAKLYASSFRLSAKINITVENLNKFSCLIKTWTPAGRGERGCSTTEKQCWRSLHRVSGLTACSPGWLDTKIWNVSVNEMCLPLKKSSIFSAHFYYLIFTFYRSEKSWFVCFEGTEITKVQMWYEYREDHLERKEINKLDGITTEHFKEGRSDHLLCKSGFCFYQFHNFFVQLTWFLWDNTTVQVLRLQLSELPSRCPAS